MSIRALLATAPPSARPLLVYGLKSDLQSQFNARMSSFVLFPYLGELLRINVTAWNRCRCIARLPWLLHLERADTTLNILMLPWSVLSYYCMNPQPHHVCRSKGGIRDVCSTDLEWFPRPSQLGLWQLCLIGFDVRLRKAICIRHAPKKFFIVHGTYY